MGSLVKLRRFEMPAARRGAELPEVLLYMAVGVVAGLLLAFAVVAAARGGL
jgi:hypothetical protein